MSGINLGAIANESKDALPNCIHPGSLHTRFKCDATHPQVFEHFCKARHDAAEPLARHESWRGGQSLNMGVLTHVSRGSSTSPSNRPTSSGLRRAPAGHLNRAPRGEPRSRGYELESRAAHQRSRARSRIGSLNAWHREFQRRRASSLFLASVRSRATRGETAAKPRNGCSPHAETLPSPYA